MVRCVYFICMFFLIKYSLDLCKGARVYFPSHWLSSFHKNLKKIYQIARFNSIFINVFLVLFLTFSYKPQISQFHIFDVIKMQICIFVDVTKKSKSSIDVTLWWLLKNFLWFMEIHNLTMTFLQLRCTYVYISRQFSSFNFIFAQFIDILMIVQSVNNIFFLKSRLVVTRSIKHNGTAPSS